MGLPSPLSQPCRTLTSSLQSLHSQDSWFQSSCLWFPGLFSTPHLFPLSKIDKFQDLTDNNWLGDPCLPKWGYLRDIKVKTWNDWRSKVFKFFKSFFCFFFSSCAASFSSSFKLTMEPLAFFITDLAGLRFKLKIVEIMVLKGKGSLAKLGVF